MCFVSCDRRFCFCGVLTAVLSHSIVADGCVRCNRAIGGGEEELMSNGYNETVAGTVAGTQKRTNADHKEREKKREVNNNDATVRGERKGW